MLTRKSNKNKSDLSVECRFDEALVVDQFFLALFAEPNAPTSALHRHSTLSSYPYQKKKTQSANESWRFIITVVVANTFPANVFSTLGRCDVFLCPACAGVVVWNVGTLESKISNRFRFSRSRLKIKGTYFPKVGKNRWKNYSPAELTPLIDMSEGHRSATKPRYQLAGFLSKLRVVPW